MRPQRDRAVAVVRGQQRRELLDLELVRQALDEPPWVGPLDSEPRDRVARRVGQREGSRSLAQHPAQDGVDEARGTSPASPRETDARIHGRIGRHAVEEQELVEPEPQRRPRAGIELREWTVYELAQVVIE